MKLLKQTQPIGLYLFLIIWVIYLIDSVVPVNLTSFGIQPRNLMGLIGIPLAPFIHYGFWHISSNSVPLLVLSLFLYVSNKDKQLQIILSIILLSGIGTWLFGSNGIHVGASGLVMGLWSFLIAQALIKKSFVSIAIAIAVFILYGGFAFIILDVREQISWSSHFYGLLAGLVVAKIYRK